MRLFVSRATLVQKQCSPLMVLSRTGFFSRKDKTKIKEEPKSVPSVKEERTKSEYDESMTVSLNRLAAKSSITTKRPYKPPSDVEDKIRKAVLSVVQEPTENWISISLKDSRTKYKVLSQLITIFNHNIPNSLLNKMETVSDAVNFYNTEVKQTSAFEDLGKLDLPKNLHIQWEYNRFDPETDVMYGGRTAFPGSDTVVTSIKYKRKYKSIKTTVDKPGFVNHYYHGF